MLEEHRTESGVHDGDSIPRRVESPANLSGQPHAAGAMHGAPSSRTLEPQRHTASPAQHGGQHYRPSPEELFNQLQSQLHLHSNILEEQRHNLERLDGAVQRLQAEQSYMVAAIREVRTEVQTRPPPAAPDSPDSNEIDILTERLQSVASKANEVEGLKLEINIMRRQLRRLERHASPALGTAEPMGHEHSHPPHPPPPPHIQGPPAPFSAGTPSAPEQRPILYQTPSENRLPPPIMASAESRNLGEQHASSEPRTLPGFHSIDPASSTISSWRPAGGYTPAQPGSGTPASGPPTSTPQGEAPAVSGWAAVNTNTAPKRTMPGDAHSTSFDAPQPGSPKRQRLAPLMPRVSYGEQNSTAASSPYQPSGATPDSLPQVPSLVNSRNPSNESQGSLPPPSNPLRFVLSTQDAPSEDSWRPESQRPPAELVRDGSHGSPRRGRGGGRGRGRKSGGGEEHGTTEWESPSWSGSQVAPNGYYQPGAAPTPQDHSRGNLVRRGGGHVGGPSDHPPPSHAPHGPPGVPGAPGAPVTQSPAAGMAETHVPQASLYPDPHFMPITTTADVASSTAGTPGAHQPTKKTRTKPIRNADGVLIRKDGRPDMRSVSSAMNLKKVHAKKEAERQSKEASTEGGKEAGTPHSSEEHDGEDGSPGSPAHNRDSDLSADEEDEVEGQIQRERSSAAVQDRHAANIRKIFPYGILSGGLNLASSFFPSGADAGRPQQPVKIEAVGVPARGVADNSSSSSSSSNNIKAVPSRENTAAENLGEREKMVEGAPVGSNGVVEERRDVEMGEAGAAEVGA